MQKRQKIAHELILMRFHPFIYDIKTKGYTEIGINVFQGKVMGLFTKKVNFIPSIQYYCHHLPTRKKKGSIKTQKRIRPMSSYLDSISLDNKGFFYLAEKRIFSCGANERNPERVLSMSLARSQIQRYNNTFSKFKFCLTQTKNHL